MRVLVMVLAALVVVACGGENEQERLARQVFERNTALEEALDALEGEVTPWYVGPGEPTLELRLEKWQAGGQAASVLCVYDMEGWLDRGDRLLNSGNWRDMFAEAGVQLVYEKGCLVRPHGAGVGLGARLTEIRFQLRCDRSYDVDRFSKAERKTAEYMCGLVGEALEEGEATPEYVGPREPTPTPRPTRRAGDANMRVVINCFYDMGWLDEVRPMVEWRTYRIWLTLAGYGVFDEERCIAHIAGIAGFSYGLQEIQADEGWFNLGCFAPYPVSKFSEAEWETAERVCGLFEEVER